MKVYGITGGAGTGKSEVIKMLQQNFGGCVIMSDEVARELMQKGNISYQLIVEYFGRDILMDDGESTERSWPIMFLTTKKPWRS